MNNDNEQNPSLPSTMTIAAVSTCGLIPDGIKGSGQSPAYPGAGRQNRDATADQGLT